MQSVANVLVDWFGVTSCACAQHGSSTCSRLYATDCQINIQSGVTHVPSTNVHVSSMVAAASVQDVALHCRYTDYIVAIDLFHFYLHDEAQLGKVRPMLLERSNVLSR